MQISNLTGLVVAAVVSLSVGLGCTLHHTKVPLADSHEGAPSEDAVFITEDDSGLALLGIFVITEPDHYAILVERARRRHKCATLHHIQFDFYTDFWLFVGFPISRITAICEPERAATEPAPEPAAPRPPAPPLPPTPAPPAPVPAPVPDAGADG